MAQRPRTQAHRRRSAKAGAANGASRPPQPTASRGIGRWLAKALGVVCVSALVVGLIVWTEPLAHLQQMTNRPIAGVTIEGQFHYISQQEVQSLVVERVTENFLQLDMEALKKVLERNAWIDKVAVSRQWPDRLVVRIKEQQPIARWGENAFVNMRGDIVKVPDNSRLEKLPLLKGHDRYARDVMQKYVRIMRILSPAELLLKEVHLDNTLSWTLRLDNGLEIRIGREDVFDRLQRLLDVYPSELAAKSDKIASIDLRYDNGFAVGWKQMEQLAMAEGK